MCHQQTLTGPQKHRPKKINYVPCTICYTEIMKNLLKVTIVKTTKLQPLELIQIELSFYNVNCIQCFTSMITVVCEDTIMIWIFTNSNKRSPVIIILFILKTLRNQQNTCRHVRVNDDSDLEK